MTHQNQSETATIIHQHYQQHQLTYYYWLQTSVRSYPASVFWWRRWRVAATTSLVVVVVGLPMKLPTFLLCVAHFPTVKTRAYLLLLHLNIAKNHGCRSLVAAIAVLRHIPVRLLTTTKVALEIALRLEVALLLEAALLLLSTRWLQHTLHNLAVITAVSKLASMVKVLWLLHHNPLLHSWLQTTQKRVPGNNIVQPFHPKLQLQLPKSRDVLGYTALLTKIEHLRAQLHVAVYITKLFT